MSVARTSKTKEPRAHLEGFDLPADFKLPELALVRKEADDGMFDTINADFSRLIPR